MSPVFRHAVVAAEDASFYQHHGFDWREIQNAVDDDLADKRVLTFVEDIDEGGGDFGFTVRGTKPGRWDVPALVEEGDSVLLAGTTIAVTPQEDEP